MTMRLSISSFAGTARTLVAVGHLERGLHVGDDAGRGAAQRLDLALVDRAGGPLRGRVTGDRRGGLATRLALRGRGGRLGGLGRYAAGSAVFAAG